MKSLDEVIEEVERCWNNITDGCGKCPEFRKCFFCVSENPSNDPLADAMHYLKEYREKHKEICETAKVIADSWELHKQTMAFEYRNDPLSWDELKQMEGKPVWAEYNLHLSNKEFRDKSKRWCIIREIKHWEDTEIIITENGFVLSKREQINAWQAYRKERE